uniref:Anticodon_1 domain-containing protein n=1 Tax=Soboliphyme baturini TaxID=241478 RepID=A0A183IXR2_9BILA
LNINWFYVIILSQAARDKYREWCCETPLHRELILRFIETQAIILSPVCPHVAEKIWQLMGKAGSVLNASWPVSAEVDAYLLKESEYMEETLHDFRIRLKAYVAPKSKAAPPPKPTHAYIYVTESYSSWQATVLQQLQKLYDATGQLPDNKEIIKICQSISALKPVMKKVMPFVSMIKDKFATSGSSALSLTADVKERAILTENLDYLRNSLDLIGVEILPSTDGSDKIAEGCRPGKPMIVFRTEQDFNSAVAIPSMDEKGGRLGTVARCYTGSVVASITKGRAGCWEIEADCEKPT